MGLSFRAAARELGIPATTAKQYARRIGIHMPDRGHRSGNITSPDLERLRAAVAEAAATRGVGRPPSWGTADRSISATELRKPPTYLRKHGLPEQCPGCGLRYADTRSGLTFATARVEVACSADREASPFFGARAVISAMRNRKLLYWREHIESCGRGVVDCSDHAWRLAHGRRYIVLSEDERNALDAGSGDALVVTIDGDEYPARLDDDRLVVHAPWQEIIVPASWVRVHNPKLRETEEVPF